MPKHKQKHILSHLHPQILQLSQEAIQIGLIQSCIRSDSDTYLLHKTDNLIPTELSPLATACHLLVLLKKV